MADGRIQGSGDQESDLRVSNFTDRSGGSEANQGEVRLSIEPPTAQASKAHWSTGQTRRSQPRRGYRSQEQAVLLGPREDTPPEVRSKGHPLGFPG